MTPFASPAQPREAVALPLILLALLTVLFAGARPAAAAGVGPDRTGERLFTPPADSAAAPGSPPSAEQTARNEARDYHSINFVWTLVAGFLVMFMQAGFALLETGMVRAKNAAHTM